MKHRVLNTFLAFFLVIVAVPLITGCDPESNPVSDFLYETHGSTVSVTDQHGHTLNYPIDTLRQLESATPAQREAWLTNSFRQHFPQSYLDPDKVTEVTAADIDPGEVRVSAQAQTAVSALNLIPGYGTLASLALSGALGIGAIFMGRRASVAEKTATSLVKGIDTFRDILDQTPQGEVIERSLINALGEEKLKAGQQVNDAIHRLLSRHTTPNKPRGGVPGYLAQ